MKPTIDELVGKYDDWSARCSYGESADAARLASALRIARAALEKYAKYDAPWSDLARQALDEMERV